MKILYITNSLEPKDGWGRYGNSLVEAISKNNEVLVVCFETYKGSNIPQKKILHSPHSIVSPIKIFFSCKRIQKVIDSFGPDVVHFIVEPYVTILPFLRINKNTKTILTVHGTYSFIPFIFIREKIKLWLSGKLIKKAYGKLDLLISVSSFTRSHVLNQYKDFYKEDLNKNKIVVVSNGININNFAFSDKNKSNSENTILFVGAIKKRKGILESLDALAIYRDKYGDNFNYKIVGSYKPNEDYIQQVSLKIKEHGLEKLVKFTGKVSDSELLAMYSNASLFLMLPVKDGLSVEGFGLVYLEANINGVPTIGSVKSGAEEAISDGISGYLVDPFNPSEVADKISSVINDRSIKSENCIEWAKKQDIGFKVKMILEYYKHGKNNN